MTFKLFAAALCCAAQTAWADVPDRLEAAFRDWAVAVGAPHAVLTIYQDGQHVRDVELGIAADRPVELASLSKAITGVCAAKLISTGVWTDKTRANEVLGQEVLPLTVAELLTHSAGLAPDLTQGFMQRWVGRKDDMSARAVELAFRRAEQEGKRGAYLYNNENYAILGLMIEAETGRGYQNFCTEQVLQPAGVSGARRSERTGSFLPWAGWQMSVRDYAAFHWHAFGPTGMIGIAPETWPSVTVEQPVNYGVGMYYVTFQKKHYFSHHGMMCLGDNFYASSFAAIYFNGYSAVAAYDICLTEEELYAFEGALLNAVFQ